MSRQDESPDAREAAARQGVLARIDGRDFKLVLAGASFTDLETDVRELWRLARSLARQNSAIVSESREAGSAQLREVVFLDTPNGSLFANGYTLRKRAPYAQGRPGASFEVVLAFRSPDPLRAAGADVRSAPQYEGMETFREELVLVADSPGGIRSLYSHGCRLREHHWEMGAKFSDVTRIFPGISDLKVLPTAAIKPVGETPIEEVRFRLGSVDFGGGAAGVSMAVWRDARTKQVLAGEFAFQTQSQRHGKPQPQLRSERFYRLLGEHAGARIDFGATKTAVVYALAGKKPQPEG